jgi:predicted esterase
MKVREEHIQITRSARLCLLGDPQTASELWVVCHGYGQLVTRFIRGFESIAESHRLIVAPEGLHRFYLDPPPAPAKTRRVGATWMTREDRETDIHDYVAYLDAVVAHVQQRMRQRARIIAFGFSQGTATVFRWAALGSSPLAAVIAWAGEVPRDLDAATFCDRLRHMRVVFVRGTRDEMVSEQGLASASEWLERNDVVSEVFTFDGGHELDARLLGQIAAGS